LGSRGPPGRSSKAGALPGLAVTAVGDVEGAKARKPGEAVVVETLAAAGVKRIYGAACDLQWDHGFGPPAL
jgi:hypothetical protein